MLSQYEVRKRLARRRALWVLLWRAARWRLLAVGVLAFLQGLTPLAAIVISGMLIGAVPDAIEQGAGSPPAERGVAALCLFGAVLLVGAGLAALADYQVHVLDGRYGRAVHQIVARATLSTPGIAALEDPRILGEVAALEEFERADGFVATAASLRELIRRRSTGIGVFAVLFAFAWWAPVVLLVGWRGLSYGIRRWLEQGMELDSSVGATQLRRSRYLRGLAVESGPPRRFGSSDSPTGSCGATRTRTSRRCGPCGPVGGWPCERCSWRRLRS